MTKDSADKTRADANASRLEMRRASKNLAIALKDAFAANYVFFDRVTLVPHLAAQAWDEMSTIPQVEYIEKLPAIAAKSVERTLERKRA